MTGIALATAVSLALWAALAHIVTWAAITWAALTWSAPTLF